MKRLHKTSAASNSRSRKPTPDCGNPVLLLHPGFFKNAKLKKLARERLPAAFLLYSTLPYSMSEHMNEAKKERRKSQRRTESSLRCGQRGLRFHRCRSLRPNSSCSSRPRSLTTAAAAAAAAAQQQQPQQQPQHQQHRSPPACCAVATARPKCTLRPKCGIWRCGGAILGVQR